VVSVYFATAGHSKPYLAKVWPKGLTQALVIVSMDLRGIGVKATVCTIRRGHYDNASAALLRCALSTRSTGGTAIGLERWSFRPSARFVHRLYCHRPIC